MKVGDKVRIGQGAVLWDVERVAPDGMVAVKRRIGVGRLGRHGRTTWHFFGPGQARPTSVLTVVEQAQP